MSSVNTTMSKVVAQTTIKNNEKPINEHKCVSKIVQEQRVKPNVCHKLSNTNLRLTRALYNRTLHNRTLIYGRLYTSYTGTHLFVCLCDLWVQFSDMCWLWLVGKGFGHVVVFLLLDSCHGHSVFGWWDYFLIMFSVVQVLGPLSGYVFVC